MTDTTDPAAELRAAAQKLRTEAASAHRASPAPWAPTDDHVVRAADGMLVADRSETDHPAERADLPYIATMDPGLGLALADWLERAAVNAAVLTWPNDVVEGALAVARQVLGTTTGQPETAPAVDRDAEFERFRRLAEERRVLTPNEHDRAWHAIEGSAGEEGADPGTVLNAVLHALRIDPPTAEAEQAASPNRRLAAEAQQPTLVPAEETKR